MRKKTLNKVFKEITSSTEPLELPKEMILKTAGLDYQWSTDSQAAIICTTKSNPNKMQHILQNARNQTNSHETRFTPIRKSSFAIEGPLLLLLSIINHPDIETIMLKPV